MSGFQGAGNHYRSSRDAHDWSYLDEDEGGRTESPDEVCPNCGKPTDWELVVDDDSYLGTSNAWYACVLCGFGIDYDEFHDTPEEEIMQRKGYIRITCGCGAEFWGKPGYGYCERCADDRERGVDLMW